MGWLPGVRTRKTLAALMFADKSHSQRFSRLHQHAGQHHRSNSNEYVPVLYKTRPTAPTPQSFLSMQGKQAS